MDYVIEAAGNVAERKAAIVGYEVVEAPCYLRHFTARLTPRT